MRVEDSPVSENDFESLKDAIIQNVATAFAEPELFAGLDPGTALELEPGTAEKL